MRGLKAPDLMNFSHSRFVQIFKHSFLLVCSNFYEVALVVNSKIPVLYYFKQCISIFLNTKNHTKWGVEHDVCFGTFSCLQEEIQLVFRNYDETKDLCCATKELIELFMQFNY